jgi:hemerythrin-like domain-containing protein
MTNNALLETIPQSSSARRPLDRGVTVNAPSAHEALAQSLLRIHTALRRTLDTIVRVSATPAPEADRDGFGEFCERFTHFLHTHHDGEEEVIFPKLTELAARAKLPVYATDVTGWRHDHEKLLGRLDAFEEAAARFRKGGSLETLHRTAAEVREVLYPHLATEEAALDAADLAKLMSAEEAVALDAASAKHGQRRGGPVVLVLLVYALTDDEQKAQFGAMPWIVRKLLLKRIWSRSFRSCLKYAHNASIAL